MENRIKLSFFRGYKILFLVFTFISTILFSQSVLAEVSIPQDDQTQTAPLNIPNPATSDPRYLSGFGVDNAYTIFYEDRADTTGCPYGARIYFVRTIDGPLNFSAPVPTNICDTHFVVKDWPVTIGGTTYAYRAWGSRANNSLHNFYVSNDLVNWIRNPIAPNTPFTFNDPSGTLTVYYGFHDVIQLNRNYMGFAETNGSRTVLVWSDEGTNNWDVIAVVGGAGAGPLDLDVGSTGPTPTGSFVLMEVNGQQVYGKLGVPGDDSGAFLAINQAAAQASTPAGAEAAFLDPANWTWSDGTTGIPNTGNRVLSEIAQHDVREVWTAPLSNSRSDHVIFYTARYATGSDLGCAATTTDCVVVAPPPEVLPDPDALPDTGFSPGRITILPPQPASIAYTSTSLMLEIPSLNLSMPIVGVPQSGGKWDITWLGNNAGYLYGTAFPTWPGNTALTGHVYDANGQPGPFVNLGKLWWGSKVYILAWGMKYTYEVRSISWWTKPDDVSTITKHEEYDWITLVTCRGYNEKSESYKYRTVVRAVLIKVEAE